VYSVRPMAAAVQGDISNPAMDAPKNTMNICMSSGVFWKSWMYALLTRRSVALRPTRANRTTRPAVPPSAKAMSDSMSVASSPSPNLRRMGNRGMSEIMRRLQWRRLRWWQQAVQRTPQARGAPR